jgi:hypothetical protein
MLRDDPGEVVKKLSDLEAGGQTTMPLWSITAKTEFADREVTELFKIRYTPVNHARGVDRAQYHALQMTTKPGEKEGTTIEKTVLLERLNPQWMGERFDPKFLRMVRTALSRAGFYMKWIYVPVGDPRQDEKPPSDLVTKFPVHYTQKNHDTCLFKSVASALHHLNKKQIASFVSSTAMKYMYTPVDEQLNKLGSIAQENDCDLLVTKWMTRKRVGKFDLKTETSDRWALVVIPLGGDRGIGHAITIVGDLIFDSTQSHALTLRKNSLDWCCANDRGFESIYMAIKFA